jgi:hypothetical protein
MMTITAIARNTGGCGQYENKGSSEKFLWLHTHKCSPPLGEKVGGAYAPITDHKVRHSVDFFFFRLNSDRARDPDGLRVTQMG